MLIEGFQSLTLYNICCSFIVTDLQSSLFILNRIQSGLLYLFILKDDVK